MAKRFVLKSPTDSVYTWQPYTADKRAKRNVGGKLCNVRPGTQDQDFVVTYVHDNFLAYVECDYVE